MEIAGKIIEMTPEESGSNERGTWRKRTVVIRTLEQNPVTVAFTAMGLRCDQASAFSVGMVVSCRFGVSSRKVNERWYSDIQLWEIKEV